MPLNEVCEAACPQRRTPPRAAALLPCCTRNLGERVEPSLGYSGAAKHLFECGCAGDCVGAWRSRWAPDKRGISSASGLRTYGWIVYSVIWSEGEWEFWLRVGSYRASGLRLPSRDFACAQATAMEATLVGWAGQK